MNLIKADIYKILKGKAMWVVFAIMLANVGMIVLTDAAIMGVMIEGEVAAPVGVELVQGVTGVASATQLLFSQMNNMPFFVLGAVMIVSAPIFANGTVKNDIARGISRTKIYVSKVLIASGLALLLWLAKMALGISIYGIANGFAGELPVGFWTNLAFTSASQLFILLAVVCFTTFLMFTLKRSGMVIGIFMAVFLLPMSLISLLNFFNPDLATIMANFDLITSLGRLGFINQLDTWEVMTVLGGGAAFMVISTIVGLASFRKAEIK
ncbi:MAG: ABC transporter permease [Defluviitaleaceae bacterium]|nr:ABC transporter permease [Defluviitaleaceae bacterium]